MDSKVFFGEIFCLKLLYLPGACLHKKPREAGIPCYRIDHKAPRGHPSLHRAQWFWDDPQRDWNQNSDSYSDFWAPTTTRLVLWLHSNIHYLIEFPHESHDIITILQMRKLEPSLLRMELWRRPRSSGFASPQGVPDLWTQPGQSLGTRCALLK